MTDKTLSVIRLCVDLCSGLGGFSQAFNKSPDWEVITVDIQRKFKPTICADVRFLPLRENLQPDLLLASPPCERFSIACHTFPKIGIKKAMELVGATFEAVAWLKPKEWLIENPMGRLRWFLGTPAQTIRLIDYGAPYWKKTDLWGSVHLPWLRETRVAQYYMFHQSDMHAKHPKPLLKKNWKISEKTGKPYRIAQSPLTWMSGHNREIRALMPMGLSQAVLEAVRN